MADLYLGYAAFAHYTKENGYELSKQGQGLLSLWLINGKMHVFPIYTDEMQKNCGCVYTNDEDLKTVFNENTEFIALLLNECVRPNWGMTNKMKNDHCSINKSLWGKLNTVIYSGETIKCKR